MDTAELIKKVRKVEIKTRGLSKHLFTGEYHSAFKGRGMSFSEVRDYQYGDDVRDIDWNVTARTGIPHVKVFEEERELTVMLLVDISPSVHFGTHSVMRSEIITEISAVLAFSAINNNDKVGLILFDSEVRKFIPPGKGKKHILHIIRELIETPPDPNGTDLSVALEYFSRIVKKRSICFILSDFHITNFEDALRSTSRRHDIVGIHTYDKFEKEIPKAGLIRVQDAEKGTVHWLDTNNRYIRREYRKTFSARLNELRSLFQKLGCDLVSIQTEDPYILALHQLFKRRARR